jgi:hypothetical protein
MSPGVPPSTTIKISRLAREGGLIEVESCPFWVLVNRTTAKPQSTSGKGMFSVTFRTPALIWV